MHDGTDRPRVAHRWTPSSVLCTRAMDKAAAFVGDSSLWWCMGPDCQSHPSRRGVRPPTQGADRPRAAGQRHCGCPRPPGLKYACGAAKEAARASQPGLRVEGRASGAACWPATSERLRAGRGSARAARSSRGERGGRRRASAVKVASPARHKVPWPESSRDACSGHAAMRQREKDGRGETRGLVAWWDWARVDRIPDVAYGGSTSAIPFYSAARRFSLLCAQHELRLGCVGVRSSRALEHLAGTRSSSKHSSLPSTRASSALNSSLHVMALSLRSAASEARVSGQTRARAAARRSEGRERSGPRRARWARAHLA